MSRWCRLLNLTPYFGKKFKKHCSDDEYEQIFFKYFQIHTLVFEKTRADDVVFSNLALNEIKCKGQTCCLITPRTTVRAVTLDTKIIFLNNSLTKPGQNWGSLYNACIKFLVFPFSLTFLKCAKRLISWCWVTYTSRYHGHPIYPTPYRLVSSVFDFRVPLPLGRPTCRLPFVAFGLYLSTICVLMHGVS
jgi:hypothetical protein